MRRFPFHNGKAAPPGGFSYILMRMALTWAMRQRAYIISGFIAAGLLLLATIVIVVLYDTPTCSDGKQNQDERGIDCGGSCAHLCAADVEPVRVPLVRPVVSVAGRTDLVAYVENRNSGAEAKGAPYVAEVFDDAGRLLGAREGSIDLPPRSIAPLFIPGILSSQGAVRAFVSFPEGVLWRTPREGAPEPSVRDAILVPGDAPRVRATVHNPAATPAYDRRAVATIFGADGLAIAASQTVVRYIDAYGTAEAIFTWPEPFTEPPIRIEVRVVPVLP